jgi:hypothetical protein
MLQQLHPRTEHLFLEKAVVRGKVLIVALQSIPLRDQGLCLTPPALAGSFRRKTVAFKTLSVKLFIRRRRTPAATF